MTNSMGKTVKTTQEQAITSWTNYLNQVRLEQLHEALSAQDQNLSRAMSTLEESLRIVREEIVSTNRGGTKGMHGFIAEITECGVSNARRQVVGKNSNCVWVNDNGPVDIVRGGVSIQQKFVNSGNHLSLQAIKQHSSAYPDFLLNGGKYQIPEDHYEKIKCLLNLPEKEAMKMPTKTSEFSLKQWKEVQAFFKEGDIKWKDIEPSKLSYGEVQQGKIESTYRNERKSLRETDEQLRKKVVSDSRSTLQEGAKVVAVSAGIEGTIGLISGIYKKKKSGKILSQFSKDDWKEVIKETGKETAKGGLRGAGVYVITNATAMPAAVACSIVTSSMNVAELLYQTRKGEISWDGFVSKAEDCCVLAAVSAYSSMAGQAIIPIPILGAVIGNIVGTVLYQNLKGFLSEDELGRMNIYMESFEKQERRLSEEYQEYLLFLRKNLCEYMVILDEAFDVDSHLALEGSAALANWAGVPQDKILRKIDDVDDYMLN